MRTFAHIPAFVEPVSITTVSSRIESKIFGSISRAASTGIDRVESVTIAPVDENKQPIMEKAEVIPCDTLLLSVGLIPENELSRAAGVKLSDITKGAEVNQFNQTEIPYIFACGNVLHVNDLVDHVSMESEIAGQAAADFANGKLVNGSESATVPGEGIRYVCPQRVDTAGGKDVTLYFRTLAPGRGTKLSVKVNGEELAAKKVICTSPGTMENLVIPKEKLAGINGDIVVTAVHDEAM